MPELDKQQLVIDEMAKDPNSKWGAWTIKECLLLGQSVHLTRDFIEKTMHEEQPQGFELHEPMVKKIKQSVLVCLGPHHEWSGDGHDKLLAIGFPIWGESIGYLFLKLVHEYGGIPIQMSTDCGSELITVYGFANALREEFASDLPIDIYWDTGAGIYNASGLKQDALVQWLWLTLIQAELDRLKDRFNNHVVRLDRGKFLPSRASPNIAFSLYEKYKGDYGLQLVDREVIVKLMEDMGGKDLIRFVSIEYAAEVQQVLDSLDPPELSMDNIWDVFQEMLPHM
ncbi:hypothetical protein BT96DRAFT_990700 [Gymnopus androsaceus JB14]|uniref:Uncharacterized protein n=1 Tax=Gymnopus androsaceus JB14 TaxID=1447944 RepID=A0A6A4I0U2_9AGAR|nr:hypothetical protein BT96DRAFT_990700 [Gymnopus androsaceus JB14]